MPSKSSQKRARKQQGIHGTSSRKDDVELQRALSLLPQISEADLLSFQFAHFGDDSQPAEWFVDAETALNYTEVDDGLGWYADGVKRTLTDANIEFFRALEQRQAEEAARREAEPVDDEESKSTVSEASRRPKEEDVPYDERNKRKWEQYIEAKDAVQGSLTHRRMARELDDQKTESVEMDY